MQLQSEPDLVPVRFQSQSVQLDAQLLYPLLYLFSPKVTFFIEVPRLRINYFHSSLCFQGWIGKEGVGGGGVGVK